MAAWVFAAGALMLGALAGCAPREMPMDEAQLREFAARYTAAWCSQDAARVASFFAQKGSLTINEGAPSIGREAITLVAQGFMTSFPDMVVTMDGVSREGRRGCLVRCLRLHALDDLA